MNWIDALDTPGPGAARGAWPVVWTLIKIVAVLAPLMGCVAYAWTASWERKFIGFIHAEARPRTGSGPRACCSRSPTR